MSKKIYLMKFSCSFKRGGIRKNPAPFYLQNTRKGEMSPDRRPTQLVL